MNNRFLQHLITLIIYRYVITIKYVVFNPIHVYFIDFILFCIFLVGGRTKVPLISWAYMA
jgi:hypothetical protein